MEVVMPKSCMEADDTNKRMTEKGISGKVVKEVVLPEESSFETPCYLIEMRNIGSVKRIAINSLKHLASAEKGTDTIPIYLAVKEKVTKIGYGEKGEMYSLLASICRCEFDTVVYANEGDGFYEVSNDTFFGLRLDL